MPPPGIGSSPSLGMTLPSCSVTWRMITRYSPASVPSPGSVVVRVYVPSAAISPPAALPDSPTGMNVIDPPP